jgi:AP-3 complex subunit mu
LDGGKQALRPQLTGTMVLETKTKTNHSGERQRTLSSTASAADRQNPPITVTWKIPLASVSGLTVSGLSLSGEAYKPYKGVRNITKSGRFQIRCY